MMRIITSAIILLILSASGCSFFIPMHKPIEQNNILLLWLPGASSVQVLSDWNSWGGSVDAGGIIDPLSGRMDKDDNGVWTIDLAGLPGGIYRYAFYVNGYKWIRDPVNPETAEYEGRIVSIIMVTK